MNSDKLFSEAMEEYYITTGLVSSKKRYTTFKTHLLKVKDIIEQISPELVSAYDEKYIVSRFFVSTYTTLYYFYPIKWPLYEDMPDISENVYNGVADAFVDVIWDLAEKEGAG